MSGHKILNATDSQSVRFSSRGLYSGIALLDFVPGPAWQLMYETPTDPPRFIPVNVSFDSDGVKSFVALSGATYVLIGGVAGASAWVHDVAA